MSLRNICIYTNVYKVLEIYVRLLGRPPGRLIGVVLWGGAAPQEQEHILRANGPRVWVPGPGLQVWVPRSRFPGAGPGPVSQVAIGPVPNWPRLNI